MPIPLTAGVAGQNWRPWGLDHRRWTGGVEVRFLSREVPTEYIVFKPLDQIAEEEAVSLVLIAKELLSFTMPYSMYLEMESNVDDSFLGTTVWEKLRNRW